jgi:hypothetical protein
MREVSALSHRICEELCVKPVGYSKCGYFSAGRWLGPIDLLVRDNYVTNVLLKIPGNGGRGGAQDLDLAAQLHLAVFDRPKGSRKLNSFTHQKNF